MAQPQRRGPHSSKNSTAGRRGGCYVMIGAVLLAAGIAFAVVQFLPSNEYEYLLTEIASLQAASGASFASQQLYSSGSGASASEQQPFDPRLHPLEVPPGKAQNLPSIRVQETETEKKRNKTTKYGGAGDKKHLGGFTEFDLDGVSPTVWKYMIEELGVKSFLDVGCGRGTSTSWFLTHGADVLCAEGSHDAVEKSFLPDPATQVVEHDFSRGPWWPEKTYDAVWSVEFLEHVNLQYHFNYITAFRKAALLFVSSSRWGGWHHVEVHSDEWWIRKYEMYGFKYDKQLTEKIQALASTEARAGNTTAPNGEKYNAQHIWLTMKVFTNPAVGAFPQHHHLFPEPGCFQSRGQQRECGTGKDGPMETPLDPDLAPLKLTPQMDDDWAKLIRKNLGVMDGTVDKPKP